MLGFVISVLAAAVLACGVPDYASTQQGEAEASKPYEWPDAQPENCPFAESKEITKVRFTGRFANYTGADTWFPMWAPDGNCYSGYTDGRIDSYVCVSHYATMKPQYEDANHHTGQAALSVGSGFGRWSSSLPADQPAAAADSAAETGCSTPETPLWSCM